MSIEEDAKRYQWLKSRCGLSLTSTKTAYGMWTRENGEKFFAPYTLCEGGTQHGAYPSLDELIDAAMVIAEERDNVRSKNKP
jgi:hypothetical protein